MHGRKHCPNWEIRMASSVYRNVGIASLIMIGSVFLSRLFGVLREMTIAYLAGTSGAVDAYQVSFIIPEILNHILATGFLSITFIPIFTKYISENREKEAWQVFSNILNTCLILLIVLVIAAGLLTDRVIDLTGLTYTETVRAAVRMTRIILPAQLCFFAGGLLMAVQFAKEKFLIPALAPLIYNVSIIAGGVVLFSRFGMEGFSWGVLFGAFLGNFAVQWFGAKSVGMSWFPIIRLRHPEFKKYIILTLPLFLGLTATFSLEIFPKLFGSFLAEGSVASLNYGLRIMFLLVGLLGQAVGTASYPYLSRMAAENKMSELNHLLNATLKRIALVIPCSVLVVILRREIVFIIFERGRFGADSTLLTANVLVCLMIGAFAFSAQTIVNRGYYAVQNTLSPTLFVTSATVLTLPLYYLGMIYWEIYGIALALSLSTIIQVFLLFMFWNKKSDNREGVAVYWFYLKMALLSIPIGGLLFVFKTLILKRVDPSTMLGSLMHLFSLSILFVFALIGSGYLLKIKEIFEISDSLIKRLRRH